MRKEKLKKELLKELVDDGTIVTDYEGEEEDIGSITKPSPGVTQEVGEIRVVDAVGKTITIKNWGFETWDNVVIYINTTNNNCVLTFDTPIYGLVNNGIFIHSLFDKLIITKEAFTFDLFIYEPKLVVRNPYGRNPDCYEEDKRIKIITYPYPKKSNLSVSRTVKSNKIHLYEAHCIETQVLHNAQYRLPPDFIDINGYFSDKKYNKNHEYNGVRYRVRILGKLKKDKESYKKDQDFMDYIVGWEQVWNAATWLCLRDDVDVHRKDDRYI